MSSMVEVYTSDAVVTGLRAERAELRGLLETGDALHLQQPNWTPLTWPSGLEVHHESLAVDDIIAAVDGAESRRMVHANWHEVILDAGPYRISGSLAVLPGFDPGRALTRPGSTFLELCDARLEIIDHPEAGELERETVLVNRYSVDRVASDLILGFFFPAAHFDTLQGVPATG